MGIMRSRIEKKCLLCGIEFTVEPKREFTAKYCSVKCKDNARKGKPGPNLGKKFSEEWCTRLSESHKGNRLTEQAKNKVSEFQKSRVKSGEHHLYKDGRNSIPGRRDWQKNQWHRRVRKAPGSHTYKEWQALKEKYNFMCLCCKKQEPFIKLTIDHIIPLSMGGPNDIENLQPLCKSCNCRKATKLIRY